MIEIHDLVKRYGAQTAVDHLDLTIEAGQVCGLLGLNGAGKTTTMNMITGYLAPTEGQIIVNGHDILEEAEEAKRCIGYLPDQPPLYTDMTVSEYLNFCAQLKQLPKAERAEHIQKAVELTGLQEVSGRLIRNLSKGYRQRVGLAQAILGLPEIIILDEPTDGLDPRQINEMLALIRTLGEEHTVILSSHKLSEVQMACDRIVILHQGRVIADGRPEELEQKLNAAATLTLTALADRAQVESVLAGIGGIGNVTLSGEDGQITVQLEYTPADDPRQAIFFAFADARLPLIELKTTTASLEQVFLSLTQEDAPQATESTLDDAASDPDADPVQATQKEEEDS